MKVKEHIDLKNFSPHVGLSQKTERYHYFQPINGSLLEQLQKARMRCKKLFLSNSKKIFEMTY